MIEDDGMSGRLYRAIKHFPWRKGGNPTPDGGWEGGESVAYEPGDTVHMEDQDLESMYLYVEALDDAGRAALEAVRAKKGFRFTAVADISSEDAEFLARALRREDWPEERFERTYATLRDGTTQVVSTGPAKPLPGVIYGDDGLPDTWATARQRERRELESKLARIRTGGSLGGRQGGETKRDKTARPNEALLAAVQAHQAKHPNHGGPAIAAALVDQHGKIRDHADPRCREKAIEALRKRIARLEKSLDT
ncbi:MAG TPA: hypothetical protein VGH73_17590 [Thermoanaerobaculia bacterium]